MNLLTQILRDLLPALLLATVFTLVYVSTRPVACPDDLIAVHSGFTKTCEVKK